MKKIFNIQLLAMMCFVMAIGLFSTSCKKEIDVNSGVVELLSFGPTGVKHGDQITFIGKNLDKVKTICGRVKRLHAAGTDLTA